MKKKNAKQRKENIAPNTGWSLKTLANIENICIKQKTY